MAMKSIVISCRKIIENVEEIEESPEALKLAIPVSEIEITKAKVMKLLTHLMSVAKKCTSRPSSLDMNSIRLAISELTNIVQVLIFQVVPRSQKNGAAASGVQSALKQGSSLESSTRLDDAADVPRSGIKTMAELKSFLEKQTEIIVKSLHVLLNEMRSSKAVGPNFSDILNKIIVSVDNLLSVFGESMAQPRMADLRKKGESCLFHFSNAKFKFRDAGNAVIQDSLSNANRRMLASSSYHIAKVCYLP